MRLPAKTVLGIADAPYRGVEERRLIVRWRIEGDRDCWFVTSHPRHGPHAVPLSFLAQGSTIYFFTEPRRPSARNIRVEERVLLVFGGYEEAVVARGTCRTVPLAEVKSEIIKRYAQRAGWAPGPSFVGLVVSLTSVSCSRTPSEDRDREVWREDVPAFW